MKSRLAALGVAGRRGADVPLGRARAAPPLRPGLGRPDPADQGAAAAPDRERAAGAVPLPAGGRPRDRDRVGEGAARRPAEYYRARSAPTAADPRRSDGDASTASTSDARTERGEIDFEDLLELAVRMFESDERARSAFQERYRAFTVDEYQDVNLLQQALLDQWLGASRRPLRRRRRLPVDLRLHGRLAALAARRRGALPAGDGRPAGGELPLDARGARARQPPRPEARRRREGAAADPRRRAPSPSMRGRSRWPRRRTSGSRPR